MGTGKWNGEQSGEDGRLVKNLQHNPLFSRADWRRGRDSNPRYPCEYAAFRVRCFQPLSHLSAGSRNIMTGRRRCKEPSWAAGTPMDTGISTGATPQQRQQFLLGGIHLIGKAVGRIDDQ